MNPAGRVRVGDEYLRIAPTGEFNSVDAMRDLLISDPGAGQLVYLGDVASIKRDHREVPRHLYRHQGHRR